MAQEMITSFKGLNVTNNRIGMLRADFSGLQNLDKVISSVLNRLSMTDSVNSRVAAVGKGTMSRQEFDGWMSELVRVELGKTLGIVRAKAVQKARAAGAGSASSAVLRRMYKSGREGNVNIAGGNRRLSSRTRIVPEPDGGKSGIHRNRSVSKRTQELREYYGPDRHFILRILESGRDVYMAHAEGAIGPGSKATHGRRGAIAPRNWFFHSMRSDMEQAAQRLGYTLTTAVEKWIEQKFNEERDMANKSVLELAVQTGQWDAGLKKAKTALQNFTDASGGLQKALTEDSASMQKFVQMMGRTDSQAKTAKGQLNDYKSTIEQLTMQYNQMNDAQKQSIGQDYLRSIDQLKQKYQAVNQQIQEMNRSLAETPDTKPTSGSVGGGLFGGGKLDGMLQVFGGNLMTKGAGMLAGLASEMGDMVKQGIELAKQGEGIRIAFERLGRGDILQGLREATHGTVTDLELMKAAVKFNDFKLPLDELGTMLAFAQQKAKDTGQSVDYMVDSIVTGLGRKSLMILDNLGLSASEIRERMKETGDMTKAVGAIIREQMAAAGEYVETAADRAAQANVSLQNKMEELGRKFAPVEEASTHLWTSIKIGILDIVGGPLADLLNGLTRAGQLRNELKNIGSDERVNSDISKLKGSNFKEQVYTAMLNRYSREEQKALDNYKKAQKGGMGSIAIWENRYLAQKTMREDFQRRGREVLNGGSKNTSTTPTNTITPTGTTTTPVPVKIEGFDINAASLAATRGTDTMPSVWAMADKNAMRSSMNGWNDVGTFLGIPPSIWDAIRKQTGLGYQQWDAKQDISKQWHVGMSGDLTQNPDDKYKEKTDKQVDVMAKLTTAIGGVSSIMSGLEQIGLEVPDEAKMVMNTIQGLMSIIQGVQAVISIFSTTSENANTAATIANTVALGALTTAMSVNTATNFIPFFAKGGVVHAANGFVDGRTFSGDQIPAMLNAGELVLNKSQQSTLATQLQSSGMGNMQLEAIVSGEALRFVLNSNGRRTGRGEIVTTNFR